MIYTLEVNRILQQMAQAPIRVVRPGQLDLARPESGLSRLAANGEVLRLVKGFYALVPEGRRQPDTPWVPSIEGVALGMAAATYGRDNVALVGPSAARLHRCYPRALATGYVAVPSQLRSRSTIAGYVRFVTRTTTGLDVVRADTDLGSGLMTGVEQTALDLMGGRPSWNISDAAREEMLQMLAARIEWNLVEEIAHDTRAVSALRRLRTAYGPAR